MKIEKVEKYKIVILGESTLTSLILGTVGKSSIFMRYIFNTFEEQKKRTVNATTENKKIKHQGINFVLNIWDTAGEERYHALAPIFYRDADGALLVFDLTKKSTFLFIEKWLEEIRNFNPEMTIVIAGNKNDIAEQEVTLEEATSLADKYNSQYISVSAKADDNIGVTFSTIAFEIYQSRLASTVPKSKDSRKSVRISAKRLSEGKQNSLIQEKKKSCCSK